MASHKIGAEPSRTIGERDRTYSEASVTAKVTAQLKICLDPLICPELSASIGGAGEFPPSLRDLRGAVTESACTFYKELTTQQPFTSGSGRSYMRKSGNTRAFDSTNHRRTCDNGPSEPS